MDTEIEFSAQAFTKICMHAMKYPHCICSGFLLSPKPERQSEGEPKEGGQESSGDQNRKKLKIIEAIPVSHTSHCLAPILEVAFNSVSVFAQEQELVISGYYQANPSETIGPDAITQEITKKIFDSFPDAVLCFCKFEDLSTESMAPFQVVDGKLRLRTASVECDPEAIAENVIYTKDKLHRRIVDFDDHFNNISLDWTNAFISQKIDYLIANVC